MYFFVVVCEGVKSAPTRPNCVATKIHTQLYIKRVRILVAFSLYVGYNKFEHTDTASVYEF